MLNYFRKEHTPWILAVAAIYLDEVGRVLYVGSDKIRTGVVLLDFLKRRNTHD